MENPTVRVLTAAVLIVMLAGIVFGVHSCNADECGRSARRFGAKSYRLYFNGCMLEIEEGTWIAKYNAENWFVFKALRDK